MITLKWVQMIEERLKKPQYKDNEEVQKFARPILLHGRAEELRITKLFKQKDEGHKTKARKKQVRK